MTEHLKCFQTNKPRQRNVSFPPVNEKILFVYAVSIKSRKPDS